MSMITQKTNLIDWVIMSTLACNHDNLKNMHILFLPCKVTFEFKGIDIVLLL